MTADIRLLRWPERDREDYERLAMAIARVRDLAARGRGEIVASMPIGPEEPGDADRARALLAHRRQRDAAAGAQAELFGEPGWDILLLQFIAFEEGRPCFDREIVAETGLRPAVVTRWLQVLATRSLVRTIPSNAGPSNAGPSDAEAEAVHTLTDDGLRLVLGCVGGS
jgi:hypothetical protein